MPAYAYPIKIKWTKQTIPFQETKKTNKTSLVLEDLKFAGDDCFDVFQDDFGHYEITVYRSRLESDDEQKTRIQKEERYVAEYNRRKLNNNKK